MIKMVDTYIRFSDHRNKYMTQEDLEATSKALGVLAELHVIVERTVFREMIVGADYSTFTLCEYGGAEGSHMRIGKPQTYSREDIDRMIQGKIKKPNRLEELAQELADTARFRINMSNTARRIKLELGNRLDAACPDIPLRTQKFEAGWLKVLVELGYAENYEEADETLGLATARITDKGRKLYEELKEQDK